MNKNEIEVDIESLEDNGSEVQPNKVQRGTLGWTGEGIRVKTDVDLRMGKVRQCIEREARNLQDRYIPFKLKSGLVGVNSISQEYFGEIAHP